MRIHAALADQPEIRQAFEQGTADLRALSDQDKNLGIVEPFGKRVVVLDMVVPDGDVMPGEFAEAGQRAQCVVIVVQYGDLHSLPSLVSLIRPHSMLKCHVLAIAPIDSDAISARPTALR